MAARPVNLSDLQGLFATPTASVIVEDLVHRIGSVLDQLRHHVGVGVQREADLGMAEDLHHGASRHALGEQEGGT